MRRLGVGFDRVLSSPLRRAVETARIVADTVADRDAVTVESALQPGCRLGSLAPVLARQTGIKSLLLVGHQPDMGRLASELIGCRTPVPFPRGGFCRIEVSGWETLQARPVAALAFLLPPEVLEALG